MVNPRQLEMWCVMMCLLLVCCASFHPFLNLVLLTNQHWKSDHQGTCCYWHLLIHQSGCVYKFMESPSVHIIIMAEIYGCWSHPDNGIIQWYLIGFWTVEWSIICIIYEYGLMGSCLQPMQYLALTYSESSFHVSSRHFPTGPARVSQAKLTWIHIVNTYHISI